MIKHETAFDLFQRLNVQNRKLSEAIIDRLNHYHEILFFNDSLIQPQIIELLDSNRLITKRFLHGFISDYIEYINYRNDLLQSPWQSEDISSNSPHANKDSIESDIPTLEIKFHFNSSITFLYIDTEYKQCSFNHQSIQWYDCETSTELIGTLLHFEQIYFITNPDQHYILIIDSTTQIPINDYFKMTTLTHVMTVEENKSLSIQWHTLLCHLCMKYKLTCILIEHLNIDTPIFDTIIGKRDDKLVRRNSKNKELNISFSEFAFGRLMNSEHYPINQIQYRQIHTTEMKNFQYKSRLFSLSTTLSDEINF